MAPKKAKVDPKQEAARLVIEERLVLEAKLDDEEVARIKIEKRLVLLAQKADREAAAAEKAEKERREAERLRIEAERVARRLKLEAGAPLAVFDFGLDRGACHHGQPAATRALAGDGSNPGR
jgi:hypothetical protein